MNLFRLSEAHINRLNSTAVNLSLKFLSASAENIELGFLQIFLCVQCPWRLHCSCLFLQKQLSASESCPAPPELKRLLKSRVCVLSFTLCLTACRRGGLSDLAINDREPLRMCSFCGFPTVKSWKMLFPYWAAGVCFKYDREAQSLCWMFSHETA